MITQTSGLAAAWSVCECWRGERTDESGDVAKALLVDPPLRQRDGIVHTEGRMCTTLVGACHVQLTLVCRAVCHELTKHLQQLTCLSTATPNTRNTSTRTTM